MLTSIIFLPLIGSLLIALWPKISSHNIRRVSIVATAIPLILSIIIFVLFDRSEAMYGKMQFEVIASWIPTIKANYHMGIDGLSMPFVFLTALLGFIAILVSWKIHTREKEYFAWLLLLETSILGVFCSLDLIMFYVFWELELIPMYFLISIWGSGRKEYSALKFVIYTLLGGAFILAGILLVYFSTGTLDMVAIANTDLGSVIKVVPTMVVFLFFFVGFAIKLPVFPFHTWLPDAHTDAPTAVSVMLAGVLLKMGGYAMLRINITWFPDVAKEIGWLLLILGAINIIYGGAITLKQTDIKRLIAWSSISHMGFVLIGIAALGKLSMIGATMQMFSHGIITGLLFAICGLIIHNVEERNIKNLGGLGHHVPAIAVCFIIGGLGAMAVPATSGFIAEMAVLMGTYSSGVIAESRIIALICLVAILLSAAYIIKTIQTVFFGEAHKKFDHVKDADKMEKIYAGILIALMFIVGIYPNIIIDVFNSGITKLAAVFVG
ncbi:MAG: NADH-quinone oxidoreductase subunit M [Chloroflexi bacterium]|nr:NADH-quinone oxidoreductase subunit M [Chloroflexota bacterium]